MWVEYAKANFKEDFMFGNMRCKGIVRWKKKSNHIKF